MTEDDAAEFIVFIGGGSELSGGPLGAEQDYGKVGDFIQRRKEDVAAEWEAIGVQMKAFLERVATSVENFDLHEVVFELGFSAEGHLGFIASTGAQASVQMTYRRKPATRDTS
ncbi:MAG: hypothetical protein JWL57_3492 [Actinobacteria bacterium]|nr:hypothetical protein [Actinomycetota bacterium]